MKMTTTTTDRNVKLFIRLIDSESPDTLGVVQGHMKRVGKWCEDDEADLQKNKVARRFVRNKRVNAIRKRKRQPCNVIK
mgnify:CR=1 FL=1